MTFAQVDDFVIFSLFLSAMLLQFSGYVLLVALVKWLRPRPLAPVSFHVEEAALPNMTVIVPTYQEGEYITAKLANLLELSYPPEKLKILVVDGGSTDGTQKLVEECRLAGSPVPITLLQAKERGKIQQLNEALTHVPADHIVVISDADAIIRKPDALTRVAELMAHNPRVGVVGGWTTPPSDGSALLAEYAYWDKQNRLRHMESISFSSSIVVAPFYALRRDGIDRFPDDCVADDVYVSYVAHGRGERVIYDPEIVVEEIRQPRSYAELFRQKFRKANAYTTELLRVLPRLPFMGKRLKLFYGFRIFQFLLLPWAFLGCAIWGARLLVLGHVDFLLAVGSVLVGSLLLASAVMVAPPGHTRGGFTVRSAVASVISFALAAIVLNVNCVLYPFWTQTSSYSRVGAKA